MILDSEPRPPRPDRALAIPPKADAPPLPAPPPSKAEPAKPVEAPKAAEVAPAKAGVPSPEPGKTAILETKQVAPKAPASAMPAPAPAAVAAAQVAAPKLVGFAVQVGAFRDEEKLAQARQKLAAAGVTHYTERLEAQAGALTRLRAGPFPTREAAESALAKVKLAALDGKVVPLP